MSHNSRNHDLNTTDTVDFVERRRFLVKTTQLITALGVLPVLSLQGCSDYDSDPAYAYWKQKRKGKFSDFQYIVMCGTLAANAHNTQPWLFKIDQQRIHVYADRKRNLGTADNQRRMMVMSIGCAIENMQVAAVQLGYQISNIILDADTRFATDGHCATLELEKSAVKSHPLFDTLFLRQTTRTDFSFDPMPKQFMENIRKNSTFPQVGLKWADNKNSMALTAKALQDATRAFLKHPKMNRDVMHWFRITREKWNKKRDGISIFTSDAPSYIKSYIESFSTREELLSEDFTQGEIDFIDRVSQATPFWGLLYGEQNNRNVQILAGRMAERIYLYARAAGLAVHPVSYPTEMLSQQNTIKNIFGLKQQQEPLLLFRLGKGEYLERSVRRDLHDVLI